MAKGDKQDVARAKSAATKKVRGGISKTNVGKVFKSGPGRSSTTGRSTYDKHSTSVWTQDKDRSVNTRKKINKESIKPTPKQLKDARVKANQVKPNTFGKVYYNTSKNGTQVKASYVSKSNTFGSGKTERTTVKGKPYTGSEKSTSAKISADNKNRAKNAANKMKAQGAKINSSATSGYNRRGKK